LEDMEGMKYLHHMEEFGRYEKDEISSP